MKRWASALSALALFSCAKPLPYDDPDLPFGDGEPVQVSFFVRNNPGTKVNRADDEEFLAYEKTVNRYILFVFENDTGWYRSAASTDDAPVTMTLKSGQTYRCYAMVNYPAGGTGTIVPDSITSEDQLLKMVASLSDNRMRPDDSDAPVTSLEMFGTCDVSPEATPAHPASEPSSLPVQSVEIHVSRIVSRIDVEKISLDVSEKPFFASKTFKLKNIFVTNVYKTMRWSSDYAARELSSSLETRNSNWYNPGGWHRYGAAIADLDRLTCNRDIDHVLASDSPYETVTSFYVSPNATPVGLDTTHISDQYWCARCTRVVIQVSIDDTDYYYPVNVPSMERNVVYKLKNLTIKGFGSTDPEDVDIPPESMDVEFSASADWDHWDRYFNVSENL